MNLPGVDTYVCDASATKDADARGSQICPLPDGRRKSPIGTSRHIALLHKFGRYRGKADVSFIALRRRVYGYTP
jgi:hypothetical protein